MSEEIDLPITTLTSGVKVISLIGTVKFDDGTIVRGREMKIRNRSVPQDYDFDKELVSERIPSNIIEAGNFKLMKRLTVPSAESYRRILRLIPKDCIVLVREYIADTWGFPFVCPINNGRGGKLFLSNCFYGQ